MEICTDDDKLQENLVVNGKDMKAIAKTTIPLPTSAQALVENLDFTVDPLALTLDSDEKELISLIARHEKIINEERQAKEDRGKRFIDMMSDLNFTIREKVKVGDTTKTCYFCCNCDFSAANMMDFAMHACVHLHQEGPTHKRLCCDCMKPDQSMCLNFLKTMRGLLQLKANFSETVDEMESLENKETPNTLNKIWFVYRLICAGIGLPGNDSPELIVNTYTSALPGQEAGLPGLPGARVSKDQALHTTKCHCCGSHFRPDRSPSPPMVQFKELFNEKGDEEEEDVEEEEDNKEDDADDDEDDDAAKSSSDSGDASGASGGSPPVGLPSTLYETNREKSSSHVLIDNDQFKITAHALTDTDFRNVTDLMALMKGHRTNPWCPGPSSDSRPAARVTEVVPRKPKKKPPVVVDDTKEREYLAMRKELARMDTKSEAGFSFPATAECQQLCEKILPQVIRRITAFSSHECQEWMEELQTISRCTRSNTSAIKYVLKCPDVLKKIIQLIPDTARRHHCKNLSKPISELQDDILCLLCPLTLFTICIYGSRPNEAVWSDIMTNFNVKSICKSAGPRMEQLMRPAIVNIAYSLQSIHGCDIETMPSIKREVDRVIEELPKDPVSRLNKRFADSIRSGVVIYTVFCSNPPCSKQADTDHTFAKCGRCHLTRYCSPECQVQHWNEHDHKNLCEKAGL